MPKPAINPEMSSLFMDFAQYFELSLAVTPEQKALVYSVRYSVYCEEFGYEDPDAFHNNCETDDFDDQSIHCLVMHKSSGLPAGCVRLVTVGEGDGMPMESHCKGSLDEAFFNNFENKRATMAEISRLAVEGNFRRRRGESATRFGNTSSLHFAAREERTFSLIAVSLFLAAAACADLVRRRDCFAIMEPFLPEILRRTGIVVKRVGGDFDYKGVRAPYYLNIDEAVRAAPDELRLCYEVVRSQFAEVLAPDGERKASRGQESSPLLQPGMISVA
ncbi:PEP-CTERM/exosortase system-associated acyltransferase [Congregibacter litoralis]|uniref:Putative PEP-CTERM/exosortase system-associated acyltransferase n=1 Tax=Congregibacter litoralis KT71 TaxID=314285 RepID=A4A527_9GAMM|nr:PEP-CTERM/exosortase system-associated acyltransferase [Congregibacter litoralis]EAQ98898.1 putative PEP-CTERM/exosortase system-associated acyltransferase [Congregibacter litoralis KT71]